VLPKHGEPPVLREVQHALAREQGFASWAELKQHHVDGGAGDRQALLDGLLEYACIFTPPRDLPAKWRRAERIRARHPELATASIHTAVVCGEVEHVATLLRDDPSLLTQPGGPQRWPPLLFACNGRLPNQRARERALEMATLLLDAGADPNTAFVTDDDWRLRFTALTGAMGHGEMGQPEHPSGERLARLLLSRGARANDGQGLYNTHLGDDDTRYLQLLIEHGLGPSDPIAWHADPSDDVKSGADRVPTIFDYLVAQAAAAGHVRRVTVLLEHGANPNACSMYDGKSCHALASLSGRQDIMALLEASGAEPAVLEGHDAFVAAVRGGRRAEAVRLLQAHPEYREFGAPLVHAAGEGELEVVRALLELGVEPSAPNPHGVDALHSGSRHEAIVRLLLEHGADATTRCHGATACAWAKSAGALANARLIAEHSRSLLDAVYSGHVALVRRLLRERPACIDERAPSGSGPLHHVAVDPEQAEPILQGLLAAGADPWLLNDAGRTPAQSLEEQGADQVADLLEELRMR